MLRRRAAGYDKISAAERTNFPSEVVEMELAHAVGDKVEAAYRRGDLFEKWRRLMAEWASYCNRPAASGRDKVVRMRAPGKRERRDKRSAVVLSGSSTPPHPLGAPVGGGWKCRAGFEARPR
jgi:hypothetical protein